MLFRALFTVAALIMFAPRAEAYASLLEALRERSLSIRIAPLEVGVIPRGSQRVRFLSLNLNASCDGDVTLSSIRVHRLGLGDSAAIRGVYLLRSDQRITSVAPVSSEDQTALLRLPRLVIPACETSRVDVAADFTGDVATGSEYRFELRGPEDIATDADSIEGRFPLRNIVRTEVAPLVSGTVTITFLPLSASIRPVVEQTLAEFRIEADNEAHQFLRAVTFTNDGSARDDELRNLYVARNNGRALTNTESKLDGDEVTLTFFQPFFLRKGQAMNFQLKGRAFRAAKTVNFTLDEPSDLRVEPVWRTMRVLPSS